MDYDEEFSTEGRKVTCANCGKLLNELEILFDQCNACDPFLSIEEAGLGRKNWLSFEEFRQKWEEIVGKRDRHQLEWDVMIHDFYEDWVTGDEPGEKYIKDR